MKKNTLKQSLILILLGVCAFFLALFIPKLIDSFLISVVTLFPIVTISLGCFLLGCYDLLKNVLSAIIDKMKKKKKQV